MMADHYNLNELSLRRNGRQQMSLELEWETMERVYEPCEHCGFSAFPRCHLDIINGCHVNGAGHLRS